MGVCRVAGEVAASVGEVFRRVRDVGRGEGRVHGMVGLRDGEVGVVGRQEGSTLGEVSWVPGRWRGGPYGLPGDREVCGSHWGGSWGQIQEGVGNSYRLATPIQKRHRSTEIPRPYRLLS